MALLAAKARAMRGRPPGDALQLVAYTSDQAHSSGRPVALRGSGRVWGRHVCGGTGQAFWAVLGRRDRGQAGSDLMPAGAGSALA